MRILNILTIAIIMIATPQMYAQTFTEDIADIVYNQCSTCHRPGEIGPMNLTNYEEVKNYGQTIKAVTSLRYMPPWQPDSEYSRVMDENYLTDDQIETIASWVDSGMPEGPSAAEPPFPDFPEGSLLGDPDLVLSFAEAHVHAGNKPRYYPEGLGQMLHAGSDLVMQMHYAPSSVDETDLSSVNLFFADEGEQVDRLVQDRIMLPSDLPGGFFNFTLQPEETKSFHGTWFVNQEISLMGLSPHMHLLGTDWEVYIEKPDGTRENLISIPEWDFNWQGAYYFPKFVVAPFGSVIHAIAGYDNTSENVNNPSNPPKFVTWGENTDDEMYYLPLFYVPYQDGDEDVIFEDVSTDVNEITALHETNRILTIQPNPVSDDQLVAIPFVLDRGQVVDISIYNITGQLIKKLRSGEFFGKGKHVAHFDSGQLEKGSYLVNLKSKYANTSQKFVKVK